MKPNPIRICVVCGLLSLFAIVWLLTPRAAPGGTGHIPDPKLLPGPGFGKEPLHFIENRGQLDHRVTHYIQGRDKTIYFTRTGVTFALTALAAEAEPGSPRRWAVGLDFDGAGDGVRARGLDPTPAIISYFGQPGATGLKTYAGLRYDNLWPGVHLSYSLDEKQLKYNFIVEPGADPSRIRLTYRGADVDLNADGRLHVSTPIGGFEDESPQAFQDAAVEGSRVDAAYEPISETHPDTFTYGFRLGPYDATRTLIIDPAVIVYAGFLGGSDDDSGNDIAVDAQGDVYIVGNTSSSEQTFPVQVGPDLTFQGGGACILGFPCGDAFIAKLDPSGQLVYAGYIAGSGADSGASIAVDSQGAAYVAGFTSSTEATFPATAGPDLTWNGGMDAFVAKIDPSGSALVYAGYIGGVEDDYGAGIAVDSAGNAYVAGNANSPESSFPAAVGPDTTHNSFTPNNQSTDAFLAKIRPDGSGLVYAGYIGGVSGETSADVAVDAGGNAYVIGMTYSRQDMFPSLVGPDTTFNDAPADVNGDAYIVKVRADGTGFDYAGFIGGDGVDLGASVAVDHNGNAYVSGQTTSDQGSFPVAVGPSLTFNSGAACPASPVNFPCSDAFIVKVRADGTGFDYVGYIGGSNFESAPLAPFGNGGIAVDNAGNAYITGMTFSTEESFPVVDGPGLIFNEATCGSFPFQERCAEAFVARVTADGASLDYAGYIGGAGDDQGHSIAVDSSGNAYVVGTTGVTGAEFAVAGGPGLIHSGGKDVFIAKIASTTSSDTHQITGVFEAAGYRDVISPGAIVAVFVNFVESTLKSSAVPLPSMLDGFSVTFDGMEAALFGIFGDDSGLGFHQANAQVPWDLDVTRGTVEVRVHWRHSTGETWSDPFEVAAAPASPGIFTFEYGGGPAVVQNVRLEKEDVLEDSFAQPEGSIEGIVAQPAPIGGVITVWAAGLGPVTDTPALGDIPAGGNGMSETAKPIRLFVGGVEAAIIGSPVLHPSLVGLNQINAYVPEGVPPGDATPIVIEVDCGDSVVARSRPDVTVAVRLPNE